MRILIQQRASGRYFKDIQEWTRDHLEAMDFGTSSRAIDFCVANGLSGVQLVLKFEEEEFDLVLPLTVEPGQKAQRGRRSSR
jgi:hypothetical protein